MTPSGWVGVTLALGVGILLGVFGGCEGRQAGERLQHPIVDVARASGTALPMEEIIARLQQQHYSDFSRIARRRGQYEISARDANGRPVALIVDPETGGVLQRDYGDRPGE